MMIMITNRAQIGFLFPFPYHIKISIIEFISFFCIVYNFFCITPIQTWILEQITLILANNQGRDLCFFL